jgi:hypothetical protein
MTEARNIRHHMTELVTFEFGWGWDGGRGGMDGSNLHMKMNYESLTVDKIVHVYITEGQLGSYIKSFGFQKACPII